MRKNNMITKTSYCKSILNFHFQLNSSFKPLSGSRLFNTGGRHILLSQKHKDIEDSKINLPLFGKVLDESYKNKIGFSDYRGIDYTFSELGARAFSLSNQLKDLTGENRDERIAFLLPHDSSFPITLIATWMANHVAVPLSEKHPENLKEYFTKFTEAKVIVTTKEYADEMSKLSKISNAALLVVDFDSLTSTSPVIGNANWTYSGKSNNALILFTSGTTGLPKGVLLTHENLEAQVRNICNAWEITSKDTILHVLPLHHTHGLIHALLSPLVVGARCQMLDKFNAAKAWSHLLSNEEKRPNLIMGVPTVYSKLIEEYEKTFAKKESKVEFVRATCTNKMRLMISGSAALPVPVLEKWKEITGHTLLERYGMTEIGMALTNPLYGERRPGFVGLPFETVELRIAKMSSRENYVVVAESKWNNTKVYVSDEVSGDLLVKGPSVFKEYWKNPEATKKEFTQDGWFITGDTVGFIDGSYKILGRKSVDIIKSGGYKLSALEIETQLLGMEEISDVSVVGLPDPTWGQKVAAMIVWSKEELNLERFREIAKKRLPAYACPTVIQSIKELPRNQLGKVNKKELVKLFK